MVGTNLPKEPLFLLLLLLTLILHDVLKRHLFGLMTWLAKCLTSGLNLNQCFAKGEKNKIEKLF